MIQRTLTAGAAVLASLALGVAAAPAASAADGDVRKEGSCNNAAHDWKLQVGLDDGRIDFGWEVEANRVGENSRTVVRRNGTVVATINSTTRDDARPGFNPGFEIDRQFANPAGRDTISVVSTQLNGATVCRGSAVV